MAKNGFMVFDSDIHIVEPDFWVDYIASRYKDRAPGLRNRNNDATRNVVSENFQVDGKVLTVWPNGKRGARAMAALHKDTSTRMSPGPEQSYDPPSTLQAMDKEGVDVAAVFPTIALRLGAVHSIEPGLATAICHAYNDWVYEYCAEDRRRLFPAAMLTPLSVAGSVQEVRRNAKRGFVAAFIRPHKAGKNWYDPCYDPLWAELERCNMPVGFHSSGVVGDVADHAGRRFDEYNWLRQAFVHPQELMYAVAAFLGGGVLQRFPKLRAAFLEGNCSWLQWFLWRLDELYEAMGHHEQPELRKKPSEWFGEGRVFVSIEADEQLATDTVKRLGDNGLVFSTDYPHYDSRYPHAVETFLDLPIPDKSKKKILWDNCLHLYGLGVDGTRVSKQRKQAVASI